jgi:hypothetical protein
MSYTNAQKIVTPRPIHVLAKEALDVQDACNLTGVVLGFGRAVTDLRALYPNNGTDFFNRHPIVVMWSSKISSLCGSESMTRFSQMYQECCQLAKEPAEVG